MNTTVNETKRVNYGVDAPGVIRNLFLIGIAALVLVYFFPDLVFTHFKISNMLWWCAIVTIVQGGLMLLYAKVGKFRQRNRILAMHTWTGNERVLDIGTGLGLLMIGAAKKLSTGKSIGIDIWNKEDLSSNNSNNAKANAGIEGVEDKIEIQNQDIVKTSFADGEFDVIISNLCLHNIYKKELRKNACTEIHRILKTTGVVIISDFKHTGEYAANFREMGMKVEKSWPNLLDTFPPLTIVRATKTA
ncbi:MAG TPA: class I SAM-dependent methyltransferase [Bacteroidia bacterium]|jgi:arsenite methyltransferase|nr:class I SAM-dependent methyltransferase [Bacteroidia bacterium]